MTCENENCGGCGESCDTTEASCGGCGSCSCGDVVEDYAAAFASSVSPLMMDYQRDLFSNPALTEKVLSQEFSIEDLRSEPEVVKFFENVHVALGWDREQSNSVATSLLHRLHVAIQVKTEF